MAHLDAESANLSLGSGDMLLMSRLPWRFAGLGVGFAGAEVAAQAGLQPFDEGVVAEGRAVAPLDDVMRDAGSDDPCQTCHRRRFTELSGESQFSKVSPGPET
jgi:hypothetical protein